MVKPCKPVQKAQIWPEINQIPGINQIKSSLETINIDNVYMDEPHSTIIP